MEVGLAALSGVVVVAMVGFLIYEALHGAKLPPQLSVQAVPSESGAEAAGAVLRFEVRNSGGQAASAVVVSAIGRLADGADMEKRSVTVDYVAPGSTKSGGLIVPASADVALIIEGYVDP
jgi:uncharacterized protein (TIGR02588 family)